MSLEKQIKQVNSEEHLQKNALLKSLDMEQVDILLDAKEIYKARLSEILSQMTSLVSGDMSKADEEQYIKLQQDYANLEQLIKDSKRPIVEGGIANSLN